MRILEEMKAGSAEARGIVNRAERDGVPPAAMAGMRYTARVVETTLEANVSFTASLEECGEGKLHWQGRVISREQWDEWLEYELAQVRDCLSCLQQQDQEWRQVVRRDGADLASS